MTGSFGFAFTCFKASWILAILSHEAWASGRIRPQSRARKVCKKQPTPYQMPFSYCIGVLYISGGDPKSYMTIKPVGPDSSINISRFFRRIREFSLQCRNTSHECGAGPEREHEKISFLEVRAHSMVLRSFVAWKLKNARVQNHKPTLF